MDKVSRQVLISGKVQGVFYRASSVEQARILDIKGWVRNLSDGRVEAHIEGSLSSVKAMIQWMQDGPVSAEVEQVSVSDADSGGYTNFVIM